jgi:diacylglycerol kinase family enzyme
MKKYPRKKFVSAPQPVYNIIVNRRAAGFSEKHLQDLTTRLSKGRIKVFVHEPETAEDTVRRVKWLTNKKPGAFIACGGDGTINLIARLLIRRTIALGIYPMGRFNNIYRSLFGEPDLTEAREHITARKIRKIDYAYAARHFFIGSLSIGLLPEMMSLLQKRKTPRFAISWSRLASQASAGINVTPTSIKVDAFGFQLNAQTISINLLSHSLGLPVTPASICDDGKGEITFDTGPDRAIMSSYIRHLYKKKFVYSDDIRMFRGQKIALKPMNRRRLLVDGELIECGQPELNVDIYRQRIRILHRQGEKAKL